MADLKRHNWEETNIGHNTWGPVCTVCNVDYTQGMSELGCPKRLYNYHWLPENQQINFTEPTEVNVDYKYEEITTPESLTDVQKMMYHMIVKRNLIKTTFSFIRNDCLIKTLVYEEIKEDPVKEANTLAFYGNSVDLETIRMVSLYPQVKELKSETPFLNLIESKEARINDYKYSLGPKLPPAEIIDTI